MPVNSADDDWKPVEQQPDVEDGTEEYDGKQQRILVEIVSALYVPSMDRFSDADPYVSVSMGEKKIHRTQVISNNSNPIWTLDTGSLFLIEYDKDTVNPRKDKVTFTLKDFDIVQKAKTLGSVDISIKKLIKGNGKRKVYRIDIPKPVLNFNKKRRRTVTKRTKLILRFKVPSFEEVHFMKTIQKGATGIFSNETFLPPEKSPFQSYEDKSYNTRQSQIRGWGASLLRTATGEPDEEGNLDFDSLMMEALEPSEQWIEVGSGVEGRVYLEILACNGLPNMDASTFASYKNLTDSYCCLIMEDSVINTSIINDTLSPRWSPKDRRAFVFHVHHPSSPLLIGIFDHDKLTRIGNSVRNHTHDPIGRVSINLTQFNPDTTYLLHYHIYPSNSAEGKLREEQTHNGTLIVRLRVEWTANSCKENETKNMMLAGMLPPEKSFVAVPTRPDFAVARYTAAGKHDHGFSIATLTSYVEELKEYVDEDVMTIIVDAAMTVILWRGHYHVDCGCGCFKLPLHSMVAFAWGVLVTQNYNRLLSFMLFCIAWFFLATNEQRRAHPSPWQKSKSYGDLLRELFLGTLCGCIGCCINSKGTKIEPNENLHEIQQYYKFVKERKEMKSNQKEQAALTAAELEEEDLKNAVELETSQNDVVEVASAQKQSFLTNMNPLKPILFPVQNALYQVCCVFRVVKSIVTWEENYYPFWIVTFAILGSVLVFFVPWGFIFRWLIRILVWVVLGPWMKLVDWIYFEKLDDMTADERKDTLQAELRARYKRTLEDRVLSQKAKERALKLKSMIKYLFGKYVVQVPRFRTDRFCDYPLPASTAEPFGQSDSDFDTTAVGEVCGQRLEGDMIPKRMIQTNPIDIPVPEQRSSLFRSWNSSNPTLRLSEDELRPSESQPLLSKAGKSRKKMFGLFKKQRG